MSRQPDLLHLVKIMTKSPEQIAGMWHRLEDYALRIKDPETRAQYLVEWRRRYDEEHPGWPPDPTPQQFNAQSMKGERDEQIIARPHVWRDPSNIPPRPWIYGKALLRHTVTAVLAPGGLGKSVFMIGVAMALATGRNLLGKPVHDGPKAVWYWNLEDDLDEVSRQVAAASILHSVHRSDCESRLFINSGLEGDALCTATDEMGEFKIVAPVVDALIEQVASKRIDVLIIDPFISSHQVDENANTKIDAVVKQWARVAKEAKCSIVLVHHTRKLGGEKVSAEHSRGASALVNAARQTLVLNRMDDDEASQFGIADKAERGRYFSVRDDKANRAPPENQDWYRIASVEIGNGDDVGAVQHWTPPDAFSGITPQHLYDCQLAISKGEWRASSQASQWAGHAIAPILGLNLDDRSDKGKAGHILRTWLQNGALKTVKKRDAKREEKDFIEVGDWAIPGSASPPKPQVRQGAASGGNGVTHRAAPPSTPPCRGERGGAGASPENSRWGNSVDGEDFAP